MSQAENTQEANAEVEVEAEVFITLRVPLFAIGWIDRWTDAVSQGGESKEEIDASDALGEAIANGLTEAGLAWDDVPDLDFDTPSEFENAQ